MVFSTGRLVRRSVWFHRSISLAVAFGVATATAVVAGALLVGDSMRGSLRDLTLQRLGAIDAAVIPGSFFDPAGLVSGNRPGTRAVGVIQFARAVVEARDQDTEAVRRSGNVQIVASGADFWELDTYGVRPKTMPSGDQVVLNEAAATELGVGVGDLVTVRLPAAQAVPADSPLGRRESESEGLPRLEVVDVIPNRGLGRFGLQPSQAIPLCAFLPIETVREVLDRPTAANALLVSFSTDPGDVPDAEVVEAFEQSLTPTLADFGLQLNRVTQAFGEPSETIFDYYSLTSERLLIDDKTVELITNVMGSKTVQPVMTYLANAIETPDGEKVVPYSTLTAIDSTAALPLDYTQPSDSAPAESPEAIPVVLNSWTAEQLSVTVGAPLRIAYYEPETSSGKEIEKYFAAVVSEIVPVTQPSSPYRRTRPATFGQAPTVYNDPDLTPTVPGVTDQDSINDWDLPFVLNREISRADDDYWADYRLTPKAYMPLADGQRLFTSRFGQVTGLRIDTSAAESVEQLAEKIVSILRPEQQDLGFGIIPIKAQQLAASRGTTPFDALFLSLSFFVIVAALMLVALLFRLGMEQRAAEYGTMMALGMPGTKVSRMALAEGTMLAVPGALLGVVAGVGYASLVLWALRTLWVGAVTVPFLEFHWTPLSLLIGFLGGILMAMGTILLTTRRLRKASIQPLLAGFIPEGSHRAIVGRWIRVLAYGCIVAAVGLGIVALGLAGPAQAGAFVGGGMLFLSGVLALVYHRLSNWSNDRGRAAIGKVLSLPSLAVRGIGRNPLRSTLSIGLMAVACFLIVSMSAFQMRPTESGIGGFDLIGQSAVPVYKDLNDPAVRGVMLGRDGDDTAAANIFGLRFRPGQEASCNNLYQATQPQVLGIPASLVSRYANQQAGSTEPVVAFDWAARGAEQVDDQTVRTPWELLEKPAAGSEADPVPMVLDQNTALWSLQMRGGVGEVRGFEFDDGETRYFQVVALLSNTILQGSIVVGEANFETMFPAINGYSYFLIESGNQSPTELATVLENRLGDIGMDVVDSREVLANLMAVQNTYLRTFQSLGALGLLLGTFGLAVVQLRNVLERRGELALMRAIGFSRFRLASTVMAENTALLVAGILCGAGAALAAVIPYFVSSGQQPSLLEPLGMIAIVLVVGMLAALVSVRRVLRMRLLDAL